MSYHRNTRRARQLPMGDAASAIAVANDVLHDPYFNEALCRVKQIQAVEDHTAVVPCARTAPNLGGGVGLRRAMPLIRGYAYGIQQPFKWPLIAAAVGAIGIPVLLGYAIGKGSR